jgi:hypothetical protein
MTGLMGKTIIIIFYAFREIYVSLLSTQQWAFIATSLNKSTSTYIVSFSGVVSIASAVGGFAVEQLVTIGGVQLLLLSSCVSVLACFVLGEIAFQMRPHENVVFSSSFIPTEYNVTIDATGENITKLSIHNGKHLTQKKKSNFVLDSWNLIWKHRILQLLLVEGVVHQLCTNMLNMMFLNGLKKEVTQDSVRAMLVGRFFASVNIVVCALQIFVLPIVLSQASLPRVLTKVPLIVMCVAALGVLRPGITSVMISFGVIKVLEYSVMTAASEMIYVDMGHEVRYLGKELIRYFGHKMGKSAASLLLSGLIAQFDPTLRTQSLWGAGLSLCWAYSMYQLANHLWERNRNEDGFGIFKTAASFGHLSGLDKMLPVASLPVKHIDGASHSVRCRKHSEDAALWTSKATKRRVVVKERSFSYSSTPTTIGTGPVGMNVFGGRPMKGEIPRRRSLGIADNEPQMAGMTCPGGFKGINSYVDESSLSEKLGLDAEEKLLYDSLNQLRPDSFTASSLQQCCLSDGALGAGSYDVPLKKMYGGEEDYDVSDESKKEKYTFRALVNHVTDGGGRVRLGSLKSDTHSERSQSHEEQSLFVERMPTFRRVATMSFDGELKHSRPVMLRVGSMHVSLNTLEQVAISRTKRKK